MEFINNIINTLGSIIGYLNSNSGLIAAIATVVLVGITWRYVRLTQEILKATNNPEVAVFLNAERGSTIVELCVENIGTGYASDIKFTGDLSVKPTLTPEKTLEEVEPFKSGIDYLGAGYGTKTPFFLVDEVFKPPEQSFYIVVSYRDSTEAPHKKKFTFVVGTWRSSRQFVRLEKV